MVTNRRSCTALFWLAGREALTGLKVAREGRDSLQGEDN
jgi:hypothetical protein